jgi:Domain of unknown function (DUF3291)
MGGLWAVRGTTALLHSLLRYWLPGSSIWHHDGVDYLLAQVNIARMREPLDSPLLAGFVAALDPVNAAADDR